MEQSDSLAARFDEVLRKALQAGASDIHMTAGRPIRIRRNGLIQNLSGFPVPAPQDTASISAKILYQAGKGDKEAVIEMVQRLHDEDCSYSVPSLSRFRVNICRQRGTIELVFRVVPHEVPNLDKLGLPRVLKDIALEHRGLVLVTGVAGCGKSTTLAAMVDYVNEHRAEKIITIEDPIEYLFRDKKAAITQRELGSDTLSYTQALRSALRQDPDVIMFGEMRDRETIDIALKAAETGHLVFSTVHTSDAAKTITRIVSAFEENEQAAARHRLSDCLKAAIAQRLLPRKDGGGRVAAMEVLRTTLSIKAWIEDPLKGNILDLVRKGREQYGMQTFDQHLSELYQTGIISIEIAKAAATSPTDFERSLEFY